MAHRHLFQRLRNLCNLLPIGIGSDLLSLVRNRSAIALPRTWRIQLGRFGMAAIVNAGFHGPANARCVDDVALAFGLPSRSLLLSLWKSTEGIALQNVFNFQLNGAWKWPEGLLCCHEAVPGASVGQYTDAADRTLAGRPGLLARTLG